MRNTKLSVFVLLGCANYAAAADWQATGAAGFGLYHPLSYTAPAGTAQAGIGPRYVLDAAAGRYFADRFVVEAAYTFQDGDFELSSGGRKTAFDANAHALHLDLLFYLRRREATLRPYLVGGGGAKFYHGVEKPAARPLAQFGSFRDGVDSRGLVTFGGGVEWSIASRWSLRLDLRDYATPFPTSVIVPAPGSNLSGWFHDFTTTVGVTFR